MPRTRLLSTSAGLCLLVSLFSNNTLAHETTLPAHIASLQSDQAGRAQEDRDDPASTCRLTIKLIDAETNEPLAGLVRIKTRDGSVLPVPGLYSRGTGLGRDHPTRQWHVVLEEATADVPQKELVIEVISGLETETCRRTTDLSGKQSAHVTLRLTRFARVAEDGWRNGNTHVHLMRLTRPGADEYLRTIGRADGLELVFVSFLTRAGADQHYISNSYSRKDLGLLSAYGVTFDGGEEHRHNFGPGGEGYGHVMLLNISKLIEPVSVGPGIMREGVDYPPIRRAIDLAHGDGGTAVWCHNTFGLEDVPNWLAGKLDAHNIFDGGSRGTYEETFYRFMNLGLRVPFSTGTDWFIYDFARVYVHLDGEPSVPKWLDALAAGRSFITNGPLLQFDVAGHQAGDVIRLDRPAQVAVRGQAVGRVDFETLELIHNGQVVHATASRPVEGHFEARLDHSLPVDEPGWIAIRVNTSNRSELGSPLFAHTSAVYVDLAGKRVFKRQAAKALIADMEKAIETIQAKAVFATDGQREEVLQIYHKGIATLRARVESQDE